MSIIFSVKRWDGVIKWHIRHLINECRLTAESHHRTDKEYGHEGQQGRDRHPVDVARTFENVFKHGDFYLKGAGLPLSRPATSSLILVAGLWRRLDVCTKAL
jgi:hypothetical protein